MIRSGKVFDLGIPFDDAGPQPGGGRINPVHLMSQTGDTQLFPGGFKYADDYIFMPLQGSTQWDSLAHVFYDDQMYNGFSTSEVTVVGATRTASTSWRAPSEHVDALVDDRVEELLHLERRHDHRRATHLDRDDQLAVAAGDVEHRHRDEVADVVVLGEADHRRHVSEFDRKFSWVVIAPFGNPVVPLV